MTDLTVDKASEDLKLIKLIFERTSFSLAGFNRIFLWWGLLFAANSTVGRLVQANADKVVPFIQSHPYFAYLNPQLYLSLFIAVLIYYRVSGKTPLAGLSRQLLTIWVYIILFNLLAPWAWDLFSIAGPAGAPVTVWPEVPVLFYTFAFGLLITKIFTNNSFPGWLALLYVGAGLFTTLFLYSGWVGLVKSLAWPVTFLLLGGYLELKKAGGNYSAD